MARFDLINEFSSVYAPALPAREPRRRARNAGQWTLRLAPFAAVALLMIALGGF